MTDDWRVTIELAEDQEGLTFLDSVRELVVEREARERLGDRVVVSADGPRIFLYADSRERAEEALRIVVPLVRGRGLLAKTRIERWHPDEERWEDSAIPLPETPEEREAEHERREEREEAEALASGEAEWEVRVELPSHRETVDFAERLEAEGLPVVRRWKYLLIGAASEDDANALADRVRKEAPPGSRVEAEGSGALVWRASDAGAFAVFGGLGQ